MADKRAHLAQMNAVKLGDALTDEETKLLIEHQKGRSLLLVEAIHGPYTVGLDGTRTISLLPGTVVRVPDEHAEPVRNLLRALAVGGPQALTFEDAGDAFVPPTGEAAAAVQEAADSAAAAAADPEAPLPDGEQTGEGDGDDGEPDGPWPGDEGYVAPGTEQAPASDDAAAQRAKATRSKAAGK